MKFATYGRYKSTEYQFNWEESVDCDVVTDGDGSLVGQPPRKGTDLMQGPRKTNLAQCLRQGRGCTLLGYLPLCHGSFHDKS